MSLKKGENVKLSNKVFKRLTIPEIRNIYKARGWKWMSRKKYKRYKKYKKGMDQHLRNYISYNYRTRTKKFGRGCALSTITQLISGTLTAETIISLYDVAFSAEFKSFAESFIYYKILGVGITFMPQNYQTNRNLFFLINWNGVSIENMRISDNINIVPPFITRPKTFFFKIPSLTLNGQLVKSFRETTDKVFEPTIQIWAPDNTYPWQIRIDIPMIFRTYKVKTIENVIDLDLMEGEVMKNINKNDESDLENEFFKNIIEEDKKNKINNLKDEFEEFEKSKKIEMYEKINEGKIKKINNKNINEDEKKKLIDKEIKKLNKKIEKIKLFEKEIKENENNKKELYEKIEKFIKRKEDEKSEESEKSKDEEKKKENIEEKEEENIKK